MDVWVGVVKVQKVQDVTITTKLQDKSPGTEAFTRAGSEAFTRAGNEASQGKEAHSTY